MKEKIKDLFLNSNKTPFELAEIFRISESEVVEILKEFGLKIFSNRKYRILRGVPLTKLQSEFIIGCILGNGKLKKYGKRSSYFLFIEEDNKNIILWKKLQIANLVNLINNDGYKFNFSTIAHNELNTLHNKMFTDNKITISESLSGMISPLSMAVFFVDKGIVSPAQTIKFKTSNYSLLNNENLKKILKINFNINSKVCGFMRNNIQYHYLSLNKRNSEIFMKIIRSHIMEILND